MSTTLENEAVATVENEATQTDWMGDLGGGLGSGPAAGRGRCAAASGRARSWHRTVDGRAGVGLGQAAEVPAAGGAHVVRAVRAAGAAAAQGASGHAGHGDRRAGRLIGSIAWFRDNVRRLRPEHRPVDPSDRLIWLPGDAAQCDLWFPPRNILLEDGSKTLLPVLVITCAHSRFMLGRMIPTRHTQDLLLGMWELLRQRGRIPRRLIWDNESGIGRGKRHADGVGAFTCTLATTLVRLRPMTLSRRVSWSDATGSSRPPSCRDATSRPRPTSTPSSPAG